MVRKPDEAALKDRSTRRSPQPQRRRVRRFPAHHWWLIAAAW